MRTKSQHHRIPPPPLEAAKADAQRPGADRLARVPPLERPAPSSVIPLRRRGPGAPLMAEAGGPPLGRLGSETPRWGAIASFLIHALVIALMLLTVALEPPPAETAPAAISVVLANGGELENAAPKAERHGPPQHARAPQPHPAPHAAPHPTTPTPKTAAPSPPKTNFNLAQPEPLQPFAFKAPAPVPRRPAPRYMVMNNAEFYGSAAPAPETQIRRHGMNLQLSQAELAKLQAPEFSIKGKVGADWKAAFTRWVNEHKYYPREAIEMGQEGSSTIHLVIHRDGSITGLRLVKSSGSAFLDEAWLGLFRDTRVPPFPPGTKTNHVEIVATMHFRLIR